MNASAPTKQMKANKPLKYLFTEKVLFLFPKTKEKRWMNTQSITKEKANPLYTDMYWQTGQLTGIEIFTIYSCGIRYCSKAFHLVVQFSQNKLIGWFSCKEPDCFDVHRAVLLLVTEGALKKHRDGGQSRLRCPAFSFSFDQDVPGFPDDLIERAAGNPNFFP